MISKEKVKELVAEALGDGPLFLVDVHVALGNKINVELDGDQGVGIDDCVKVSRYIESSFDREEEDFELQVSSAGIGSPLKNIRQFTKNIGREVSLRTTTGVDLVGKLKEVGDILVIELPADKKKKLLARSESFVWNEIKECKVRISFK